MLGLGLRAAEPLRLLCLGAHSDDIEIGCGGTVLRLLAERPGAADVTWVVLGAAGERGREARSSAEAFLAGALSAEVVVHGFRDGFFPYAGGDVKDVFESLKRVEPDVILTHTRDDRHQDHRLVCELTWNTWRNHLILEYEIPKWDGDLGAPNLFVHVPEDTARRKVELLLEHFPSQRAKAWFTEDTFLGLMRLRGVESNSAVRYAEGFYAHKLVAAL